MQPLNASPFSSIFRNRTFIFLVYLTAATLASVHKLYTHDINNFLIFKNSFIHLLKGLDLYALHPEAHFDYFKYSPTFALLMFPFGLLPNWAALILWNLLNAVVLFFTIYQLDFKEEQKGCVACIIFMDLLTSIQNNQSNGFMAAFMLLAFIFFEKNNSFLAAFFIIAASYIKIFGALGAIFLFLYPHKIRSILSLAFWFVLFALLPLIFIPFKYWVQLYKSWWGLLAMDYQGSTGFTVMGILKSWFHLELPKRAIQLAGLLILLLPLARFRNFSDKNFRTLFLASLLIWSVLFNHKAESATFVIAMTGVAIWFISQPESSLNLSLLWFALVLTSLSSTDLFPRFLREQVYLYSLKALPCSLIWLLLVCQLFAKKPSQKNSFQS